jgi:hypothetical protein
MASSSQIPMNNRDQKRYDALRELGCIAGIIAGVPCYGAEENQAGAVSHSPASSIPKPGGSLPNSSGVPDAVTAENIVTINKDRELHFYEP